MGLKMPGDDDILAAKVLLMRAGAKSKAKSWLASSEEEQTENDSGSVSKKPDGDKVGEFVNINTTDENSGLGVSAKHVDDDISNRQLLSANEALRRKLLSKDAYRKFNQKREDGTDLLRSRSKKVELAGEDEEEGGKGRSIRNLNANTVPHNVDMEEPAQSTAPAPSTSTSRTKKRPGSYLDEVLANRKGKQRRTTKRKADDD